MTWIWIPFWVVCVLFVVWLDSQSKARESRETLSKIAELRCHLAAAESDLKTARMDIETHKARADGMEDRAASSGACEPTAEPTREIGWLVELGPGGPWATLPDGANWGRKYASIFDSRAQGDQWIADSSDNWVSRFPRHLMTVIAVDRKTGEPIEGGGDVAAISALATSRLYVVSLEEQDADAPKWPKGTLYAIRSIDKEGSFQYIADIKKDRLSLWTSDLSLALLWPALGIVMIYPRGLRFEPDGNLYVASSGINQVNHDLAVVSIPPGYLKSTVPIATEGGGA